ncbi:MAG: hypothetical protein ABIH46_01640 [Chloroflexota bacterium]
MKKLMLVIVASLLSLSVQGIAMAKAPVPFEATIEVVVTDGGTVVAAGNRTRTTGEIIQGTVVYSPQWTDLQGAAITVNHNSNTRIDPNTGEILDGHAHATFEIVKVVGGAVVGTIAGNYRSKIGGSLVTGFSDEGRWNLVKATGVFARIQSHGTWNAWMSPVVLGDPPVSTYAGLATLSGTYH